MPETLTHCKRCGAPIQWGKSSLITKCEFCGQPVSSASQYLGTGKWILREIKIAFNRIPLSSKEKINNHRRILLEKQNILSANQIDFLEQNRQKIFSQV